MAVKMRLSRKGRKKAPFYHIIVADARSPRDGKFIEKLGSYNPMTKPATIEIDRNAAYEWLVKGAQPTDTVKAILRFKGVYYKKHLMRGVAKGAMTVEQADTQWQQWIDSKESKITARKEQAKSDLETFRKKVSGEAKPKMVVADAVSQDSSEVYKVKSDEIATEEIVEANAEVVAAATQVEEVAVEAVAQAEEVVVEVANEVVEVVAETAEEVTNVAEEVVDVAAATVEEVATVVEDVVEIVEEAVTETAEAQVAEESSTDTTTEEETKED